MDVIVHSPATRPFEASFPPIIFLTTRMETQRGGHIRNRGTGDHNTSDPAQRKGSSLLTNETPSLRDHDWHHVCSPGVASCYFPPAAICGSGPKRGRKQIHSLREPAGEDLGPIWDRSEVDLGPIWDRSGVWIDMGSILIKAHHLCPVTLGWGGRQA